MKIVRNKSLWITCIALLATHFFLGAASIRNKNNTVDELNHLTAGYAYWTQNDFRLNPENGNLPQRWEALPLLAMNLDFPPIPDTHDEMWTASHRFFYKNGNDPDRMMWSSRMMTLILSLALGVVVFIWSKALFGVGGGLISLTIYCFSPTILANARLTTSDLAAAFFFLLSIRTFCLMLHHVSVRTVFWNGLSVGGLMLTKMSAVIFLPCAILIIILRVIDPAPLSVGLRRKQMVFGRRSRLMVYVGAAFAAAALAFVVIWAGYGFRFQAAPDSNQPAFQEWRTTLQDTGGLKPAITFIRDRQLLPEAWIFGFAYVVSRAEGHPAFLDGQHSHTGWRRFFPLAFLYKTPLTILALITVALLLFLRDEGKRINRWELIPIGIFILVYGAFAISSHFNIGIRHILPIYPPIFILCGMTALLWRSYNRWAKTGLTSILVLLAVESTTVWPDYLAFFNLAGR